MRRLIGLIAWPVLAVVGWLYGVLRPGNADGLP